MFIKNAIGNHNIVEIKKLSENICKDDKIDIIFEMYNNNLLTSGCLQFIMKYYTNYLEISKNLVKKLMKDGKVSLLDIIFNHFKIYDNEFILQLLIHSKNRIVIFFF